MDTLTERCMLPPTLYLSSREDTIRFLAGEIAEPKGLDKYRVRSEYVVEAIKTMQAEGRYAYNAHLKQRLSKDLLNRENADAHNEGDALSLLIYCAQGFLRADQVMDRNEKLIAQGYVPFTTEIVREAYDRKMVIEHYSGRVYRPRYIRGALYAMVPRSRTKHAKPDGSLVVLVKPSSSCPKTGQEGGRLMLKESPGQARRTRPGRTKLNGERNAHKRASNARKIEWACLGLLATLLYTVIVAQVAIANAMEGLKCP